MKFGGMGKDFGHMGSENPRKVAAGGGGPGPGGTGSPVGLLLALTNP